MVNLRIFFAWIKTLPASCRKKRILVEFHVIRAFCWISLFKKWIIFKKPGLKYVWNAVHKLEWSVMLFFLRILINITSSFSKQDILKLMRVNLLLFMVVCFNHSLICRTKCIRIVIASIQRTKLVIKWLLILKKKIMLHFNSVMLIAQLRKIEAKLCMRIN